jgi:hypothetical protein
MGAFSGFSSWATLLDFLLKVASDWSRFWDLTVRTNNH